MLFTGNEARDRSIRANDAAFKIDENRFILNHNHVVRLGEVTLSRSSSLETSREKEERDMSRHTQLLCEWKHLPIHISKREIDSLSAGSAWKMGGEKQATRRSSITMIDKSNEKKKLAALWSFLYSTFLDLLQSSLSKKKEGNTATKEKWKLNELNYKNRAGKRRRRERWLIMEHQDTVWPETRGSAAPLTNSLSIEAFCLSPLN